jgi:SEC-C motif domain protein
MFARSSARVCTWISYRRPVPSEPCPCGSGEPFAACCEVLHDGLAAPTALALMRSRYTAFVRGNIDYLMQTHAASTRAGVDRAALASWSRDTLWMGLEIVATERGGEQDDDGIVEFIARGVTRGSPFAQRERSRFSRADGRWYYVDGVVKPA